MRRKDSQVHDQLDAGMIKKVGGTGRRRDADFPPEYVSTPELRSDRAVTAPAAASGVLVSGIDPTCRQ
jgi:hypothetical protein